jgi:methylated-DNA-[protein]-cysteine S-methyltransferase
MSKNFSERVLELTRKIPRGKVTTYSEIARALGRPGAGRAVGNALKKNKCPDKISCYRVVRSDGFAGGYSSGNREKIRRLERDGIKVRKGKVELEKYFHSFSISF